jgi:putative intracellular protease/amidase
MSKKVLVFVTNHATLGEAKEKNGTYLAELTHALEEFSKSNLDYDLVSIEGGNAPIYGHEDQENIDPINEKFLSNEEFRSKLNNTMKASDVNASDYDAVFYPGGFGILYDIAKNEQIAEITKDIYEANKPVAAVCHGPAGLLPIKLSNGKSLLDGKHVTGFTREEEIAFGTINKIPYLLEESLMSRAYKYSKLQPWSEHVIVDGLLVTGQNPASASAVGAEIVKLINA